MRTSLALLLLSLGLTARAAPPTEAPASAPEVVPSNARATPAARAALAYLAALSRGPFRGALAGQNCGHGSQIADPTDRRMGFAKLAQALEDETGKAVALLGVDYEHDRIFDGPALHAANAVLIQHWRHGGLVMVTWSPHSPWVNDELDIVARPGTWTDSRVISMGLNLDELLDPASPQHATWQRKLDRVAAALAELRDAGVVVLFRPMQEMNGNWFWWGFSSHIFDPGPYHRLWRDMHRYFSEVKKLDNLLWVYSPADDGRGTGWAYPGDAWVDVVAGTAYRESLRIARYDALVALGKPVGMAEWGVPDGGPTGTLDVRQYVEAIRTSYPRVAFFVAWHDWDKASGGAVLHSLVNNRNAAELMNDPDVIARDGLPRFAGP